MTKEFYIIESGKRPGLFLQVMGCFGEHSNTWTDNPLHAMEINPENLDWFSKSVLAEDPIVRKVRCEYFLTTK